ncbi:GNAT family N-acetyltransferase [Clostridium folliculivorans]|uniref:Zwittermicin A resistance protein ZmaR n=1 Tax=Clostridium folliculivorans TaxID=2886038 RepID=A0A9W5Y289_9CLOT|nr:GNAT family N-acetyltransferase [Clostridium folliculivorans]GKU25205.1 zwittermicin A resistance protein ZmaR [Clostridium folliculivorans]GKU31303.1 zwittermicin A resistance protein ZmaR [Clostridium folliculivorans]
MIKIDDSNRHYLKKLCSCRKDDIMLLWFLEGNPYCDAWVDDVVHPEEAVIIAADFCYLLGEVKHLDEIEQTLKENALYKIIIPCGLQWVKYLNEHLPDKVRCYKRYAIKHEPNVFDKNNLKQLIKKVNPVYEIKQIDDVIYKEVLSIGWAADGCCFFRSYEDFKKNGLGYVIYKDRQLVCIASSYITYKSTIGITIGTLEEHRRMGLAAACAASLILTCLERGIYPEWEAANMDSVNLSEKLGYHFDKEFEVYSLL